jgi:hypothetical protein
MTDIAAHLHDAHRQVRQVARNDSPFLEKFARVGYAAKGVVYCIVGLLAAAAAFGNGGETTGSKGALHTLSQQPFGQVLLAVVAVGLLGYSLWQFIRAVEDPEGEGNDAKAIALRIGFFFKGVLHFLLVMYAINIIVGWRAASGGGDNEQAQSWSATAMSYPAGRWAVGIAGACVVGYGVWQLIRAFSGKLDKKLRMYQLPEDGRKAAVAISRFGIAARGVVFVIIGVLLALAAYRHNPNEARGVGGALDALQQQPYGPWLLAVVAIGLIAYGVYEFIRARYRQITPA